MPSGVRLITYSNKMAATLAFFLMFLSLLAVINPLMAAAGNQMGRPDQIILSWTDDPYTTQTVAWRAATDTGQERLQYLPVAGFNGSFTDAWEATAVKTELYAGYYHFEITLPNLSPNTRYIYRVGGEGAWSEPAFFTTATSGDKFSFVYMGDVQQGYEDWGKMLQRIDAESPGPRFAILGGDLVYDGNSKSEWEQFFTAATPTFQRIPLLTAPGNHDDAPLFWNTFALPQNGPEGFKEKFYSFDYGNCHIAVLDSNLMGASAAQYNTVKTWLQNDLDSSAKQWKFLAFHYPPYPVVEDGHSYNLEVNWVPLFEQCGVDVVFVGHQHVYMRTKPLRSGQVQADGEGIVYIMGNAGTKFYPAGDSRGYIAKELDYVSSYQLVSIDGDTFTMSSRDADGQVIDSYMLGNVPSVGAAYSVTPLTDAAYQTGTTTAGIAAMTVNQGISGMKYFGIELSPVRPHEGLETAVFVHLRNGAQLGLNATQADFDMVNSARAGFNVEPGDTVKAYVVDDLSNALDRNPVVLQ